MKDLRTLFNRRIIMAPMSTVCVPSFCKILSRLGCDFMYTGLITSHGLLYENRKTEDLLSPFPEGADIIAQIFGADPEIMERAAARLEEKGRFAAIDINMGCPAPKVIKGAGGAALMRDPDLAGRIVRAVAARVRLPVTVKLRSGWDASSINCLELARVCLDNGAAAVALHPRTRAQAFTGAADWSLIRKLAENLSAPVIGSGDITSPEDAARMFAETGCASVMIGRAACADPWLIGRARAFLETGAAPPAPTPRQRIETALLHLDIHIHLAGEKRGIPEMRHFIPWYLKGLPRAAAAREAANRAQSLEQTKEVLLSYLKNFPES